MIEPQDMQHALEAISTIAGVNMPGLQVAGGGQATPMSDSTLLALIGQKMQSSHQWYGTGKLAEQRMKADQYYRGEPLGNEIDGRSQVVSRDVAEAVDSMMPSLIRIFAGGDQVVVMEPSRPDAEDAAKQATDYINWQFLQQNEGFQIIYTFLKDGLLKRNGIVMAWYETRTSRQKDNYQGLDQAQFQALRNDPTLEMLKCNSYPDQSVPQAQPMPMMNPQTGQPIIDPHTGQPVMQPPPPPPMLFDCTVMSSQPIKKLVVQNVPPDEFIIEGRAVSEDSAGFLARRRKTTISDLIELGFDRTQVMEIPHGDDHEYTQERIERFSDEDQMPFGTEGDTLDPTMRKVWITEAYLRVDYDGDGVAEWRKIVVAGDSAMSGTSLLSNEEIDDHPFATWTPYPDPHRFYGFSVYDKTYDVQDIKTALLRGSLDSIYLANSPRLGAVEGQVNLDDLLDTRVGNIVRLKNPNGIVPIPTVNASPQAFEMISYMDQVREKRTGVQAASAGLDPNILNSSATGANILNNNNQQRLELIARVCAETGVKRLFRRIFELTCLHEDKPKTVRLRGKWVEVDPRDWKGRMDVTVSVGVGLGDHQQKMQTAMMMLNLDEKIVTLQGGIQGPLLTGKNIYNKLAKVVEAAGWKSVDPYYQDPDNAPPQPPKPPTPEQQIEQTRLQIEQMKATNEQNSLSIEHAGDQLEAATLLEKTRMDNETKIVCAEIAARGDVQASAVGKSDSTLGVDADGNAVNQPGMADLINAVTSELKATLSSVQQGLAGVQQSHQALTHAITRPKQIIKDENGDIVGVQ